MIGKRAVFKAYRRLQAGVQPEIEIGRFLTEVAGFANTPPLLGAIERVGADGAPTALAAAFGFVATRATAGRYTHRLSATGRWTSSACTPPRGRTGCRARRGPARLLPGAGRLLGQRTAELHRALATPTEDPAFAAEPITRADLKAWQRAVRRQAEAAFKALEHVLPQLDEGDRSRVQALLAHRDDGYARIDALTEPPVRAAKTRVHGDYHLGQVLVAQNDFYILDFEGEPARPLAERRAKSSPLKDVAGMLRSFDYAAWAAVASLAEVDPGTGEIVRTLAEAWRQASAAAFLGGYRETIAGCPSHPEDAAEAERLLNLFLLEKALYEICYDAANRPLWLRIPSRA